MLAIIIISMSVGLVCGIILMACLQVAKQADINMGIEPKNINKK